MPKYAVTVDDNGTRKRVVLESESQPSEADVLAALRTQAPSSSGGPGIGELRRREGSGEISSGVRPPPSFMENTMSAFAGMGVEGGLMTPPLGELGTPERAAYEQGFKNALKDVAPYAAAAIAPGPAVGGLLTRSALQGLSSGIASEAAVQIPQIADGKSVGSAAIDAAIPVIASTAAGPVIATAGRAIGAATKAIRGGIKSGAAEVFRPTSLTPEQLLAIRSRDVIENASGQRVPLGLAESINSSAISRDLAFGEGELLPETLSLIEETAMHAAANTSKTGRTLEDVSRSVFGILDEQKRGLAEPAKAAVNNFTKKAIGAVNKAESEITGVAKSVFGGRSFAQIGTDVRDLAVKAYDSAHKVWDDAYEAAKSLPEYQTARVDLTGVKQAADRAGLGFVQNASGGPSVIGTPAGARSAVEGASQIADFSNLDQARRMVTEMSKNVNNPSFLPGVDVRVKLDLIDESKKAIDAATAPFPALDTALKSAKQTYAENIGRFKNSLSKGILSDFGEAGGATPEAIIRRLTGADAESNLAQVLELVGKGATAGKDFSPEVTGLVREAVLSKAASAGTDATGKISIGKMFGVVDDIPKPVRDQLFPSMNAVQDAVMRDAALARAVKSTGSVSRFLDDVNLDPSDVQKAFQGDTAPLIQSAKAAIDAEAAHLNELSKLGLDELSKQTAFDLKKWIGDPRNKSRLSNTVTQIGKKNPELLQETRALFVENLLEESSRGGVFDPKKFIELTQRPTLPAGRGAPGVPEGKYSEALDTVFGSKTRQEMIDLAGEMTGIAPASQIPKSQRQGLLHTILFGYTGGPLASTAPTTLASALGRITSASGAIRYKVAAKFLTDDNLRRAAMKPIGEGTLNFLDQAVRLAAADLGRQFGKRSDLYREVQDIDASIPVK